MRKPCILAVAAMLVGTMVPSCFAQSVPKQREASEQAKRSLRHFLQTFDGNLKDRDLMAPPQEIPYALINVVTNRPIPFQCGEAHQDRLPGPRRHSR
jgi:hypothetical protein